MLKLQQLQQEIAELADAKPVGKHQLHFTLKFLGEVAESQLRYIEERITQIAKQCSPFSVEITGIGAFPSAGDARIVWAGAPALFNLQKAVQETLPPPDRTIVPHLTLARIRAASPVLSEFVRTHASTAIGSMIVHEIRLKQSTLGLTGPVYETIRAWPLGDAHA